MSFLSRNNSFYATFINVNPALLYCFVFLIITVIFSVWFLALNSRLNKKIIILNSEIESLKKKEALLNKTKKDIEKLASEIQNTNTKLDAILNKYSKNSLQSNTNKLIKNAKKFDLLITSCNSENYKSKSYYDSDLVTFNITGPFFKILDFFKNIAGSREWIKFQKLNMISMGDGQIHIESTYKVYLPKKGVVWPLQESFTPH